MTLSTVPQAAAPERSRAAGPAESLVIACAGVVLASLDLFIVNVALPSIARELGAANLGEVSWVLNAYAIVYAALLVFFGRLADRFRRDRAFLLGVAVFSAASAACAASTSVAMLIGFRVAQAAGAALVTPTSLGLVLASHRPEHRHAAVRTWTAVGALAAAIGPVVGGLLVAASWRWVFLVNVPVGLGALLVGTRRLPTVPGHPSDRPGATGVALVTFGVALVTFGLVEAPTWGWTSTRTLVGLGAGAGLLTGFVAHCRRSRRPLVRPNLFSARDFRGASAVAVLFSAAFGAMLLSITLWEQGAWGWSALRSGLAIAPGPLAVPVTSFLISGRLTKRLGAGWVMGLGATSFGLGLLWWATATTVTPDYVTGVLGGMVLTGIGVGLTLPTMMATAAGSLPPDAFATGSAVITMIRQAGLALGVAVLVAVLGAPGAHPGAHRDAFERGWWVAAGLSFAAVVPALAMRHTRAEAENSKSSAERDEVAADTMRPGRHHHRAPAPVETLVAEPR